MAAIQPISKIVNKQTKIMSTSLKRMSDIGAKNGEDMFDVIEDDMDRYGLLTDTPAAYYIPGGVSPGRQFIIRGKVDYSAERFAINLQEDGEAGCDNVAFHFNARQSEDTVVRNTKDGGDWQEEERDIPYFPFNEGKTFLIKIEVASSLYRVYVNGKHFINYGHKMDMDKVHYLFLTDGAEYYDITFQNKHINPFTTEIPGGMKVGKAVRLRGACTDSDGFAVNFIEDRDCEQRLFHFNPRPNQGCVVRNAKLGGDWGDEERDQEDFFPFGPGQYFDSIFMATDSGYAVYANENMYTTFNHRSDVNDAKYFNLQGDLDIADVQYLEPQDDGVKKIPSGLEKGDIISFRGYFKPDGDRFDVNLMNGYDDDSDIALHFNPRRNDGQVVLNNRFGGEWQEEERHDLPKAFEDKMPFEIKFIVKSSKFKVLVNDTVFCNFNARGNLQDIKGIYVAGDAFIYSVSLMRKLELPYTEKIPDGIHAGDWIVIRGTPKKSKGRFAINLTCDEGDESDIALHFNPRFGERQVVCNTREGGDWQEEVVTEKEEFPFEKKDAFEIAISVKDDKFVVFVNGDRFVEFDHRLPVDSITHINMSGIADFFEPEFY